MDKAEPPAADAVRAALGPAAGWWAALDDCVLGRAASAFLMMSSLPEGGETGSWGWRGKAHPASHSRYDVPLCGFYVADSDTDRIVKRAAPPLRRTSP